MRPIALLVPDAKVSADTPQAGATIVLPDAAATEALGVRLTDAMKPGSVVFLNGALGAGKTTLARAVIHAMLGSDDPVPSPTYTLVQHYDSPRCRIVHADLYRLGDPEEACELGLLEAFEDAAAIVEWPQRLDAAPSDRLDIQLDIVTGGGREARLHATGPCGEALLDAAMRTRTDLMKTFLDSHEWGGAQIAPLAGDASNRRYFRLSRDGESAVLMDAPPERGEDVRPFVTVTGALRARGLNAPELLGQDLAQGFLLLEDLGDAIFARVCEHDPIQERPMYETAVDLLTELRAKPSDDVPTYNADVLEREAALLTDWWVPAAGGDTSPDLRAEYLALMADATAEAETDRSALVLRDYHAENLLWLPRNRGAARVGLLDYQDALIGHPAYDLVSLLEDARRDLSHGLAEAMISRFLGARPDLNADAFRTAYDALGAQRNAKIIGIFARLSRRDGKPRYIDLIPRVWAHFLRDLSSERLEPLRRFVEAHIPEPAPHVLARAQAQDA